MIKMALRNSHSTNIMISLLLGIFILSSCSKPNLYDKYIQVNAEGWNYKDQVEFEVQITDTISPTNFYLNIRHNTDYDYRNLYLFLHTQFPRGQQSTDTLEIILAAPDGKWLGKGYGNLKENRVLLKKDVYFPISGPYTFRLEQAMREKNLKGIEDVGITIKKIQDK